MPSSAQPLTLGLDQQLCFSLYSASHSFTRLYKPLLEKLGLTYPQYLVMLALWHDEGMNVGQMAELLYVEPGTLTPLLKRLEALGHISRSRDPKDERQVRITLTAQGRSLQALAADIPKCISDTTKLPVAEIIRLNTEIRRLRDALDAAISG